MCNRFGVTRREMVSTNIIVIYLNEKYILFLDTLSSNNKCVPIPTSNNNIFSKIHFLKLYL